MDKASNEQEAILKAEELIGSCNLEVNKDRYIIPIQKEGLAANRRTSLTGHWEVEFERIRVIFGWPRNIEYRWKFKSIKEY